MDFRSLVWKTELASAVQRLFNLLNCPSIHDHVAAYPAAKSVICVKEVWTQTKTRGKSGTQNILRSRLGVVLPHMYVSVLHRAAFISLFGTIVIQS